MTNYKEYLIPDNGGYRVAVQDAGLPIAENWIEIPKGAEKATFCGGFIAFWKDGATRFAGDDSEWDFDYNLYYSGYLRTLKDQGAKTIWQRATHPEELPFIDDEPKSINDQYAEIEQVRQVEIHGTVKAKPDLNFGAAQAVGGVDATLSKRQSQYGCYEDVAHVTQQILSALRIGNYDELPAPMKESLHMIASKMARIVNGDPEYLDNWHDIGGYAKLIEKLIKGE